METDKRWTIGAWDIKFTQRAANSLLGRFGGGWQWKLGVQAGGGTLLFSLLVAELRLSRKR